MPKRLAVILLFTLSSCVGGIGPTTMRPGGNVALPQQPSLIGGVVGALVCGKDSTAINGSQRRCGSSRLDSLPGRRDTIPK